MAMMLASPGRLVDPAKMGDQEDSESSLRRMRGPYGASDHVRHGLDPPRR